jgi:hypothetical protein
MNAHVRWSDGSAYASYRGRARRYKLLGRLILISWALQWAAIGWLILRP